MSEIRPFSGFMDTFKRELIKQIGSMSDRDKEQILNEIIDMIGIDLERTILDIVSNTIEPKIFALLPNNPNDVSEFVESKLNDLFNSLTEKKKELNIEINEEQIKLEAYQILKNEILAKMPNNDISVYGISLPSVRDILSKVLTDRISKKAMQNVIEPAKITGASVAKKGFVKIITPYAIITFLSGFLGGVLTYKYVKRKK